MTYIYKYLSGDSISSERDSLAHQQILCLLWNPTYITMFVTTVHICPSLSIIHIQINSVHTLVTYSSHYASIYPS
jgi:hypothetical protein